MVHLEKILWPTLCLYGFWGETGFWTEKYNYNLVGNTNSSYSAALFLPGVDIMALFSSLLQKEIQRF